jgi:hypothetical protein
MKANERQVGGSHYKHNDLPEHWDLAIIYGWDCFQYQITKYIMRWKKKHATHAERLEDLKKARHFLDKYIENADSYDRKDHPYIPDLDDKVDEAVRILQAGGAKPEKVFIPPLDKSGEPGEDYVDQDHERLPGCLDDTPTLVESTCPPGQVRLRVGGPCVPDTGRPRTRDDD